MTVGITTVTITAITDSNCDIEALPQHIHDILDEMRITTWVQLSLLDEKELLYEKCFGEEALRDIKAELAKRGLTLNSPKTYNLD